MLLNRSRNMPISASYALTASLVAALRREIALLGVSVTLSCSEESLMWAVRPWLFFDSSALGVVYGLR